MSNSNLFDLSECTLCPRNCRADRKAVSRHRQEGTAARAGFCGEGSGIRGARAALLWWEEPCITGKHGSGAIFFSGCSLGCVFCQNNDLANGRTQEHTVRKDLSPAELADLMLKLQEQQAENINLVTASHFLPLLIPALENARDRGLSIPVVYNTGTYEKKEAIHALDGLIDIYLPDLKFCDPAVSRLLAKAPDYFERASEAIEEMVRQCPVPVFADGSHCLPDDDEDMTVMKSGVIVRHLALPGLAEDSRRILRYLYETYGNSIFISIMNQYTPMPGVSDLGPVQLSRPLTDAEYEELVDYAINLGVENGFLQEGGTASESFIPAFDGTGLT